MLYAQYKTAAQQTAHKHTPQHAPQNSKTAKQQNSK
jgi:hypothetical protein